MNATQLMYDRPKLAPRSTLKGARMDKLTELMYAGAQQFYDTLPAYETIEDAVKGYSGICYGLAHVLQTLGHNLDWRYFGEHFHDVLSHFGREFIAQKLTFQDLVSRLDRGFNGFFNDLKHEYELPRPFNNLDRHFGYSYNSYVTDNDFKWIIDEVKAALRNQKIRAGSKAYKAFTTENAQKVIDAAIRVVKVKQSNLARDCVKNAEEALKLLEQAQTRVNNMTAEWELRETMLGLAGIVGSPAVAAYHLATLRSWRHVASDLADKEQHYTEQAELAQNHDRIVAAALSALEQNETLKNFPKSVGL